MGEGVSLSCPIKPHEIPKAMRVRLTDIARRVAMAAAFEGGEDFLLRVYLAGMYHGANAGSATTSGGDREPR